jgi:hypothetical protein
LPFRLNSTIIRNLDRFKITFLAPRIAETVLNRKKSSNKPENCRESRKDQKHEKPNNGSNETNIVQTNLNDTSIKIDGQDIDTSEHGFQTETSKGMTHPSLKYLNMKNASE